MKVVVDASVGVKWFIPEDYSDRALKVLEDYRKGFVRLYSPEHFKVEVVSALRKYYLRGYIDHATLIKCFMLLQEIGIFYVDVDWNVLKEALKYSLKNGISVYDALYIVVATRIGARILTADERLYRVLKDKEPCLLLLTEYR